MRCASPKPCCAPMVASVRSTIRSSVPWRISVLVSLVDIQKEYALVPLECQQEKWATGGVLRILPPTAARIACGYRCSFMEAIYAISDDSFGPYRRAGSGGVRQPIADLTGA